MICLLVATPLAGSEKPKRPREPCAQLIRAGEVHGDTLDIVGDGSRPGVIERAIRQWHGCSQHGELFPRLTRGDGGQRWLDVRFEKISPVADRCGLRRDRQITLYVSTRSFEGPIRSCGSLSDNLAHEIGHALGLADAPETPYCTQSIMSDVIDDGTRRPRRVTKDECALVAERWRTAQERRTLDSAFDSILDPTVDLMVDTTVAPAASEQDNAGVDASTEVDPNAPPRH